MGEGDEKQSHVSALDDSIYPPSTIPFPQQSVLAEYHRAALEQHSSAVGSPHQQQHLDQLGILSFENVVLPASAYEHEQVLKRFQSVVQRDAPQLKSAVVQCRKLVYKSAVAARDAVTACREQRSVAKEEREKELLVEAERNRPAKLLESQKKHPANQALWQETAFLMNELSQLAIEEEKWKSARAELDSYEAQMVASQQQRTSATTGAPKDDDVAMSDEGEVATLESLNTATREACIAVATLETNLRRVQDGAEEAEASRRQLYETYKSNHQFEGYQDIHNQKGLFKMLSQSQNEDDGLSM